MAGEGKLVRLARNVKQAGRSARAKKKRDELRKQLEEEELSGTGPKLEQKPAPKPKKKVPTYETQPDVSVSALDKIEEIAGGSMMAVGGMGIGGILYEKNKKRNKIAKQKRIKEQADKFLNQTKSLQEIKRDPKLKELYGDWLSTMED